MEEVKVSDFEYEKTMQAAVGDSLRVIFPDLEIVGHEICLKKYRFDTVAFNVKTKSFVLIEYKKVQNDQALAQGLAYLEALIGNEGNFLEACRDKSNKKYEKNDVVWDKTKVVLIAPKFTDRLLKAAEQTKDRIELHRITKYENKIMTVEVMVGPKQGNGAEGPIGEDENVVDGLYDNLKKALYEDLHLKKKETKSYEKWILENGKTVCTVAKQAKSLVLCYTTKSLDRDGSDKVFVRCMIENGKKVGKRGSGSYMSKIQSSKDVKRAVQYLKQVCTQKTKSVVNQRKRKRKNPLNQDDMSYVNQRASDKTAMLYSELKKILNKDIPNLQGTVKVRYINWKSTANGKSIFTVAVNKNALRLSYNTKSLDLPKNNNFVRRLDNNGGISVAGLGKYDCKIESSVDIKKAVRYIKKVYTEKVS